MSWGTRGRQGGVRQGSPGRCPPYPMHGPQQDPMAPSKQSRKVPVPGPCPSPGEKIKWLAGSQVLPRPSLGSPPFPDTAAQWPDGWQGQMGQGLSAGRLLPCTIISYSFPPAETKAIWHRRFWKIQEKSLSNMHPEAHPPVRRCSHTRVHCLLGLCGTLSVSLPPCPLDGGSLTIVPNS